MFNNPASGTFQASYVGYQPTGDIDTELRRMFEIQGLRELFREKIELLLHQELISKQKTYPSHRDRAQKYVDIERSELNLDEIVNLIIPVAKKYMSLEQVQETNKFLSTPVMRDYVRQMLYFKEEFEPVQQKYVEQKHKEIKDRFDDWVRNQTGH